jgi:hypothetical protein
VADPIGTGEMSSPKPSPKVRRKPVRVTLGEERLVAPDGNLGDYEGEDSQFFVRMFKHEFDPQAPWRRTQDLADMAIVLTSEAWGTGDGKLGESLMNDFLLTLAERREKPKYVVLMNSAVKLACVTCQALDSLKKLEAIGTKVLLNKASIAHYKLERETRVGEITTMFDIVNWLCKVAKVLSL